MVTRLSWAATFRVIASRYPTRSVYDRIASAADFEAVVAIEALTNPRVREELGDYHKIRAEDRVSGPGTTPIMASFAYTGPSRFSDGSFGVYYASHDEATAVAESLYHTEQFMRATIEPSIDLDKRLYKASIKGEYDDIRSLSGRSKLYDSNSYAASQRYSARLYERNRVDGVVYRSVRRAAGECVAVYRPRLVSNCKPVKYLQFRWEGGKIAGVAELSVIRS